jgi:3',5'-cyclic AMP phosphodiesterase CpdA
MKVAHVSDLHFTHFTLDLRSFRWKRWLGMCNWLFFRKKDFYYDPLNELPKLWDRLSVDLILVGGDLTSTALQSEFQAARAFFDRCQQPLLFIPGNHDQYTYDVMQKKTFYRYFQNPASVGGYTLSQHGVELHRIAPSWWCIALDTAPAMPLFSSNGWFAARVEQHLEEIMRFIPVGDRALMLNHFPFFQNDLPRHRLHRGECLRTFLESHPAICLYLHGHTHRHTIADLQKSSLPLILDAGCPVQRDHPTWNLLDLRDDGCTIEVYSWKGAWEMWQQREVLWQRR